MQRIWLRSYGAQRDTGVATPCSIAGGGKMRSSKTIISVVLMLLMVFGTIAMTGCVELKEEGNTSPAETRPAEENPEQVGEENGTGEPFRVSRSQLKRRM